MPNETPKMQSWQVFHYARKYLTRSALYAIFGKKNARAVDYWCEDPRYTAKSEKAYDPLQGVKDMLEMLDDRGHCNVVRAALAFLAADTSCPIEGKQEIVEPLPNVSEEILADFRAVAALQRAIESSEALEEIERCMREAIAEIERTVARYRNDLVS